MNILRLKLPKIGTPYGEASRLWRAMRWLIPVGIATIALLVFLFPPETFGSDLTAVKRPTEPSPILHGTYVPLEQLAFQFFLFSMIPTVLLYRLTIAVGERCWVKKPMYGALIAVFILAAVPPFVDHLLVKRTLDNLDFVSSVPELRGKTVLMDRGGERSPHCNEYCLRLLYGSKVKQVLMMKRFVENPSEDEKAAVGFSLGKPNNCEYKLSIGRADHKDNLSVVNRAAGQIVSGNCIAKADANIEQAKFVLRPWIYIPEYDSSGQRLAFPGSIPTYGIHQARIATLEKISKTKREKLLQVSGFSIMKIMQYPTALVLAGDRWFSDYIYKTRATHPNPIENIFESAGLHLGEPKYIGFHRIEKHLMDAVGDKNTPFHQSHGTLVENYLFQATKTELDADKIDKISKIISDSRISPQELHPLSRVAPKAGKEKLIDAMMSRILSFPANGEKETHREYHIRSFSNLIIVGSDKATWSRILPAVRNLTSDRAMMVHASQLMKAYAVGNTADAERLLNVYRQLIIEHTNDLRPEHPIPKEYSERNRQRLKEVRAVMEGLCALADKSDNILPAIKADALENIPSTGGTVQFEVWRAMVRFGVDVEQLGRELQIDPKRVERMKSVTRDDVYECGVPSRA